jgi:hypothetical protein
MRVVGRAASGAARRHGYLAGAGLILSTAVLGACGGGGSGSPEVASLGTEVGDDATDSTTPTSVDREEAMLAYAECMRDNGVDMPDPQISSDGGVSIGINADDAPDAETFEAAEKECGPLMEEAMGEIEIDPEQQAEMEARMLEYAQCMRDHGIDMPDPQFDGTGRGRMRIERDGGGPNADGESPTTPTTDGGDGGDGGDGPEREPDMDPEFEAANEECAEEVGMPERMRPAANISESEDD